MKMLYLSVTLMIALMGVTAYLASQARDEAIKANVKMDLLTAQQRAVEASRPVEVQMPPPEAPAAQPAPAIPVKTSPAVASNKPSRPAGSVSTAPVAPPSQPASAPTGSLTLADVPPIEAPLTPAQRLVKAAPSIAKVKEFVPDQGFVVLSAGTKQGISEGVKFDLRRDASVVGRIKITNVDETESVANLDFKSVPSGVTVRAGDEVIGLIRPTN